MIRHITPCNNIFVNMPCKCCNPGFVQRPLPPLFSTGCFHHHHCGNDKLDKALCLGAGLGLATGLIVRFAKPIGKALSAAGKAVWSGIKWTGKAIGKAAGYAWQGIKWTGKKIGQGATWLWNNTLGRLFKKKSKTEATEGE